jgi:hypothetical protein
MKLEDEKLIRQYLLGELNEQVLAQVEARIMTDDEFDSQVQLIEDELVEEYVCSELSEQERVKFERIFLASAAGREKVEFTTAFRAYLAPVPVPEPASNASETETVTPKASWFGGLAAFWKSQKPLAAFSLATIALLLAISVWSAIKVARLQARLDELQAQQTAAQSETATLTRQLEEANAKATRLQTEVQAINEEKNRLVQEVASLKKPEKKIGDPAPLGDSVYALVLSPGGDRSGEAGAEATLTADKKYLQLGLKVPDDTFKSFRAKISKRDSRAAMFEMDPSGVRKGDSETLVILKISAVQLADDQYRIDLTGTASNGKTAPAGRYFFSVRKTP